MTTAPSPSVDLATANVRRPPWWAWILVAGAGLLAIAAKHPSYLEGKWLLVAPVIVAVAVLGLRWIWDQHPACTLCGALFLTVFSGGWAQMGFGGLPLNRLLVAVAILQVLSRAPGTAGMPRIRLRIVHLLMILTVAYALASAAVVGSLGHESSRLLIVDVLGVTPFLLFLVAPSIFAGEREREWLLITLLTLGAYLAITTFLESMGPHALVFPSYIAQSDAARPGVLRPGGPFQSPVENGFACFSCAVAAVIAFQEWRGRRRGHLALAVGAVCITASFLTLERGVWIAAVAALVLTASCTRSGRRWLVPGAILGVLAVGAVLTVFPALSERTSERTNNDQSVWERQNMTATGLRMVAAKPLFGFGWDRYESDSLEYFRQPADLPMSGYTPVITIGLPEVLQPLHDTYLAYAVELGLVGTCLWLASILAACLGAITTRGPTSLKSWKLGLLAILAFFLVVSVVDPHQLPFPMVLLMLWSGVAWGTPVREPHRVRPETALYPHRPLEGPTPVPG